MSSCDTEMLHLIIRLIDEENHCYLRQQSSMLAVLWS